MDWGGLWYWAVANSKDSLVLMTKFVANVSIWAILAISGCLWFEGLRRMFNAVRLRRHVRAFERAEVEHQLGVIEKPPWEHKQNNKELRIGDRVYHPVQRSPGGLWLQIASEKDGGQSQVYLVNDLPKLIHSTVDFHSHQHRGEATIETSLGLLFIASGVFVSITHQILRFIHFSNQPLTLFKLLSFMISSR